MCSQRRVSKAGGGVGKKLWTVRRVLTSFEVAPTRDLHELLVVVQRRCQQELGVGPRLVRDEWASCEATNDLHLDPNLALRQVAWVPRAKERVVLWVEVKGGVGGERVRHFFFEESCQFSYTSNEWFSPQIDTT